jgi:hypothetical protein
MVWRLNFPFIWNNFVADVMQQLKCFPSSSFRFCPLIARRTGKFLRILMGQGNWIQFVLVYVSDLKLLLPRRDWHRNLVDLITFNVYRNIKAAEKFLEFERNN